MTRSQNPEDRAGDDADDAIVPRWLKTAGALVGIVVALIGAFGGISQVLISLKTMEGNIQKDRLSTQQAEERVAQENRKKEEIEKQRAESEAAANLKVKEAEARREEAARDAIRLSMAKEIETKKLEESFKEKQEARVLKNNDNINFDGALFSLFKSDGRTLPSLAQLAKYTIPTDERLPSILTSLVAKLDDVEEPSEVNIIFQLFEKAGPSALGSVVDANRNALERYKSDSKRLALHQFNLDRKILIGQPENSTEQIQLYSLLEKSTSTLMSTQDPDTGLARLEREHIEDVWDQITRSLTGNLSYRELKANDLASPTVSREALLKLEMPLDGAPEYFSRDLALQLAILRQSKRSLARLLTQTRDSIDLGGADLSGLKLLPGAYGGIDFSEAFVAGADFSNAQLDPASLRTLGDAYITRERKVRPNLQSLNVRLTAKQRAAIQAGA
jgi:uncharacterized protein YjbI with pentapeptide repeats